MGFRLHNTPWTDECLEILEMTSATLREQQLAFGLDDTWSICFTSRDKQTFGSWYSIHSRPRSRACHCMTIEQPGRRTSPQPS
ncbi:hypothetical protein ACG3QT_00465, partial [Pseudomonas paraeruginosa]